MTDTLTSFRRDCITACGGDAVIDEILAYTDNPFRSGDRPDLPPLPMADEPHVARWEHYCEEAERDGVWPALQRALRQLQFGIRAGISDEPGYRAATRKGEAPPEPEPAASLKDPEGLRLYLHETLAGKVPVLEIANRDDFEHLVQALTARNEPEVVPESMGACIVGGYNNWDRIWAHRSAWKAANPMINTDARWPAEFKRLTGDKSAYQDRFILLSSGPYSAVPAAEVELEDEAWRERSMVLRRDHECTHYFTVRALGSMRNNLLDELAADYVGIVSAFGEYRRELALRAFGLDQPSGFRAGGRLEVYRGSPPLGDEAFLVVAELARRCVNNLADFDAVDGPREPQDLARFVAALTFLTLEEIAAPDLTKRLQRQLQDLSTSE